MDYFAVWFNVSMYAYLCMDVIFPEFCLLFVCMYIHNYNQNNDIIRFIEKKMREIERGWGYYD